MVNFPTWIIDCDSHSPALLDFFLSSDTSIFLKCFIFHRLSIIFTTGCPHYLWLFSCWLGRSSWTAPKSKVKFRQASNRCKKRFLKMPNLHMLIKQNRPSLRGNLALGTFGEFPIAFSTKVILLYLLYSTAQWCCLLHQIKQNCLLKSFLRTLILMTQVSLHLFSLLELIWNCVIFL